MASFLDKLLSGQFPRLESIWRTEFDKIVDEVFDRINVDFDDEPADLAGDFDETYVERELNTTIESLRADLARVEKVLAEERSRHEAAKRELCVTKAELRSARYKLEQIEAAISNKANMHGEPIG